MSRTLAGMLADREAEKNRLVRQLATRPAAERSVAPNLTLVRRYEEKVGRLREALNDENVRADADDRAAVADRIRDCQH